MKVKGLGILGAVLLVAALVVSLCGVVLAASIQTWYLNDTTSTPGRVMDRAAPSAASPSEASDYVPIDKDSSVIWIANEAAQVDVYFCAARWETDIYFKKAPGPEDEMTVYIGSWNSTTGFTSAGNKGFSGDGTNIHYEPTILSASGFTVKTGDYLAFKLEKKTGGKIKVDTGGTNQSTISGPECDPGYPTPELSTIMLTGAGLAALAGFFWLRRRKGATTEA